MKWNTVVLSMICFIGCRFCDAQAGSEVKYKPVLGTSWQIAGDPDLGKFTTEKQQPVDFGIWQAADGTWQVWSCIRGVNIGGKTRLFYRWQGDKITDTAWTPMGISMEADPNFGETKSGLQAPFVLKTGKKYVMVYGDWENICKAESVDGKTFARQFHDGIRAGMFTEGQGNNTRDPMIIQVGKLYYCYYTAYPDDKGSVYVRTSKDLSHWSDMKIVAFGGSAGTGKYSSECPFVYFDHASGYYFLFRTQHYGAHAQTSVYQSKDPKNFGVNDDRYFVTTLPVAAPEVFESGGQLYLADLLPSLKGIRISELKFEKQ